jgi:hypothetical protein
MSMSVIHVCCRGSLHDGTWLELQRVFVVGLHSGLENTQSHNVCDLWPSEPFVVYFTH